MMKLYSDELVELANQAWILNVALAELHRFDARVEAHVQAEPETTQTLMDDRSLILAAAIGRLQTRLDALLGKWLRRIVQESPELAPLEVCAEPWGCRLAVPDAIRMQIRVEPAVRMSLADAEALAARHPQVFYTFNTQGSSAEAPLEPVLVTGFSGVDLNTAKMWWSWCLESPLPHCRLLARSKNLWETDSCH